MHAGATRTLREVLTADFRGVSHCTRHGWDFWEGVTARLLEKRAPRWRHAAVADVPDSYPQQAFGPLGFVEEMDWGPVERLFGDPQAAGAPGRQRPEPHAKL